MSLLTGLSFQVYPSLAVSDEPVRLYNTNHSYETEYKNTDQAMLWIRSSNYITDVTSIRRADPDFKVASFHLVA